MSINSCLILAAGHGTRMGAIGTEIPKPLWPLFDKEILYLQLCLIQEYGIQNVFINSHHRSDILEDYIDRVRSEFNNLTITILKEEKLLDSGGGILNCLQHVEDDYLLVINADVVFLSNSFDINNLELKDSDVILLAIDVDKNSHYNRLVTSSDDRLIEIVSPAEEAPSVTFSGVSLIDVKKVKAPVTVSRFFDTVANFKEKRVAVLKVDDCEYVDLGTKAQYVEQITKTLLEENMSGFKEKLIKYGCFLQQEDKYAYIVTQGYWSYAVTGDNFFCGTKDKRSGASPETIVIDQFKDSVI